MIVSISAPRPEIPALPENPINPEEEEEECDCDEEEEEGKET